MVRVPVDADWFASLKARDERAFDNFFRNYKKLIFITAYNYLKNEVEAEDVTMLAFERLWDQMEDINDAKHLESWLYVISRNMCLDILRSSQREKTVSLPSHVEDRPDPSDYRYEKFHAEAIIGVYEMLEELPARLKDAFVLRYVYGMKPAEVAAQMKIDIASVYTLTSRALVRLRVKFQGADNLIALMLLLIFGLFFG